MRQLIDSFSAAVGRVIGFIPEILAAVVILAVGYLVSRAVGALCRRLLMRADVDTRLNRHVGTSRWRNRSFSDLIGKAVFWVGMIFTLSLAASALHLWALASGLNRILAFLPHVAVAAIIVGAAVYVGRFVSDLVSEAAPRWVGQACRYAILVFAGFMALGELGVATGIVVSAFTLLLGAAAVACAIAFGVGNIRTAGDYTRRWLGKAERNAAIDRSLSGDLTASSDLSTSSDLSDEARRGDVTSPLIDPTTTDTRH